MNKERERRMFVAGTFLLGLDSMKDCFKNAVKRYDDEQRKVIIEIPFEDVAKHMGYEEEP